MHLPAKNKIGWNRFGGAASTWGGELEKNIEIADDFAALYKTIRLCPMGFWRLHEKG
ncbi:MAG: hypothetical protein LBU39_00960 [Desulfobulbaceae bacterium]|jgi:hypothetical protein|nr:hypothetical protein [Desulfobulbaceae bacterium]